MALNAASALNSTGFQEGGGIEWEVGVGFARLTHKISLHIKQSKIKEQRIGNMSYRASCG